MTLTTLPRLAHGLARMLLWALASIAGCQLGPAGPATASKPEEFRVRIDRRDNGAAAVVASEREKDSAIHRRSLAFEVVGESRPPSAEASLEARSAARQAAVIDAFGKALIEARRSRGQSTSDFSARIGPRMTITHRALGEGYELKIALTARGAETLFVVKDGVLQHPPHDLALLRRIFEETNGEFSLLATDTDSLRGVPVATVACYLPTGFDPALPTHLAGADDNVP